MSATVDVSSGPFAVFDARLGKECRLAMQELVLTGRVLPVGARLVVRHTFRSAEDRPLEAVYAFGLPRDASLRRFRVCGEGFSVRSELKGVEEAERIYEEGIEAGHLSALARRYGDGVVNLNLGNLRPGETVTVYLEIISGVEVRDDGLRLRFPFTLAPTYHSKARAVAVGPGAGELELPAEEFGDVLLPTWVTDAAMLHRVAFDLAVHMPGGLREVSSPSHPLRVTNLDDARARVSLSTGGDVPDRDLVLDVKGRGAGPRVLAGTDAAGKRRFAAVIPSGEFGEAAAGPRRVVFVVDRSGSMSGAPMEQALRSVEACLGALTEADRFAIVAFDSVNELFQPSPAPASRENREAARAFLSGVDARGGTELLPALRAAAGILAGGGGDIFLLTDGQVAGTEPIIREAKAGGLRIHTLGIGSASQDRFLNLLARETGGVGRFVTPRERVDMAALELFAAAGRPVASEVKVEVAGLEAASISPAPADCVFAGTPLVVFGEAEGEGQGELRVSWKAADQTRTLTVPLRAEADGLGEVLKLLQGARLIASLELELEPDGGRSAEQRRTSRVGRLLEKLSLEYGLATRRTALVAVVERKGDRPGEIPRTTVVPVGMPQDVEFGAYFRLMAPGPMRLASQIDRCVAPAPGMPQMLPAHWRGASRRITQRGSVTTDDLLVEFAALIEPDGGLPGKTEDERILAVLSALLLYLSQGHTPDRGAFRPHVARLVSYLEKLDLSGLDEKLGQAVGAVLRAVKEGRPVPGGWDSLVRSYCKRQAIPKARFWKEAAKAGIA